jgi:hypothetical protein
LTAGSVRAQFPPPNPLAASSRSGQFIVQAATAAEPDRLLATNQSLVHLQPTLLAVSAERIKQNLCRELGANESWRGKVFVTLYRALSAEDGATIRSDRFKDGWLYHVFLPDVVERGRYVRVLTQVVLLELANRSAGLRSAEIPTWLVEGLARQLLASSEVEIILPPPGVRVNGVALTPTFLNGRWENPLQRAHQQLTRHPPLTFQELSWPAPNQLVGEAGELYRSSAQLFVNSLLRLQSGPACLRAFLAELPQHYNWQFAFLRAFQAHFARPLDVEKWWALQAANFTGCDLSQAWPAERSWEKLDEAVRSPIQVRTGTNELPLHAQATLQNVIRDWDRAPQTFVLQNKLRELAVVRLRASRDLAPLVNDYSRVIASYLQNRDRTGFLLRFRKKAAHRHATVAALMQLDALDRQRLALRPTQPPPSLPAQAALK